MTIHFKHNKILNCLKIAGKAIKTSDLNVNTKHYKLELSDLKENYRT